MEIFINEVSLEGQYINEVEFRDAVKVFMAIFVLINEKIQDKKLYKEESPIFINYEAIRGSNFHTSLNLLKDKSLKIAFQNIVFNKSNPQEWRNEKLHSSKDLFDCLISDNNYKDVGDTSLAEVTERKLQNSDSAYLLINFPNSSFRTAHPHINDNCLITIIKNNDEINLICLDGIDSKLALECWLEHKLNLSQLEYSFDSTKSPTDKQTILRDTTRFKKTVNKCQGRVIYFELNTERHWYVDNLHYGQASHLEVFDKTGKNHLGEADLNGNINYSKSDSDKTIDV
ncbi:hypothetical protein VB711_12880 [Cronbergia sp. UHCC 0137]|uniref:hypothetical protein n=1 Tax=Cronbergia sp. UHCC 0137 TaxID=3110239 RepID=UPI002B207AF3|nr:hypothetical protein [Cronbergia sp. UHCC 0137]MEA5618725.1 hypothetical protein [Cronbergia sp. UHCC 0137]